MSIPHSIEITAGVAGNELGRMLATVGLQGISRLEPDVLVGMFLAYERTRGALSKYFPYIATLPDQVPCALMLTDAEVSSRLDGVIQAREIPKWVKLLPFLRMELEQRIDELDVYTDALNVEPADVLWGVGHVLSRAYTAQGQPELIPAVDLLNHSVEALPPVTVLSQQGVPMTCVVTRDGEGGDDMPAALAEGDELLVAYELKNSAVESFASFGFVPQELLDNRTLLGTDADGSVGNDPDEDGHPGREWWDVLGRYT